MENIYYKNIENLHIINVIMTMYKDCFKNPMTLDKLWTPHIVCNYCVSYSIRWNKGDKTVIRFSVPMI